MTEFGEKRSTRLQNIDALLSESSGEKTSSDTISSSPCVVTGVKVITDGNNTATLTLYDNTAASGKKIDEFVVNGDERYGGAIYGKAALKAHNAVYAELSGSGASYFVFYAEPS